MFNKARKIIVLTAGIVAGGLFQSANADWNENNGGNTVGTIQDIVITLKSNPRANLEQACLAVTFANMLSGNPDHNVTLFVTLDGVSLAADSKSANKRKCTVPDGSGGTTSISLAENLENFLAYDPNTPNPDMVVCPLCWEERYPGEMPKYGVIPALPGQAVVPPRVVSPAAIPTMIGNADKILDF